MRLSTAAASYLLFAAFITYWLRLYLTDAYIPSVDLHSHISLVELLREQLPTLRFYDAWWFGGWPAFEFYSFLPHLIAAILSWPLMLLTDEPARLAVYLMQIASCALLPCSIAYFTKPLRHALYSDETNLTLPTRLIFPLVNCTLSFWFLNHDYQWHGIGAAALFNVGLFSQGLAWHLLFLYLGALLRLPQKCTINSRFPFLACFATLLLLTHLLTFAFACLLGLFCFCFLPELRRQILGQHFLALLLSSFWLIPFLAHSPHYVGQDIYRPTGDFLEQFFRYPAHELLTSYRTSPLLLASSVDWNNVLALVLFLLALLQPRLHALPGFTAISVALLFSLLVFGSGFVASSFSISFHYYRFSAYVFLVLIALLSITPLAMLSSQRFARMRELFGSCFLVFFALGITSSLKFPHNERHKILQGVHADFHADEDKVLDYLKRETDKGRVLFEYFDNYQRFPFLSAHYMTSQLRKRSGRETVNGLFIQSSQALRFPIASAKLLGIRGYHIPLLFIDVANLSAETLANQLRSFGISHLVVSRGTLNDSLKKLTPEEPALFGPYAILHLGQAAPKIHVVDKPILAYVDLAQTVPFQFFEFYFYSQEELATRYEVIALGPKEAPPNFVSALILNGSADKAQEYKMNFLARRQLHNIPLINFNYRDDHMLNHYQAWYQHHHELDAFEGVFDFLEGEFDLKAELQRLSLSSLVAPSTSPLLEWDQKAQDLRLRNLIPGQAYRLNFSHFPYWSNTEGKVYRSLGERMIFSAVSERALLTYSSWHSGVCLLGAVSSLFGLSILGLCVLQRLRA